MRKLTVAFALLSGCCQWSKTDTGLQIAAVTSLAADWYTTEKGLDCGLQEQNPAVSAMGPALYFPVTAVLHTAVAIALPPKWRNAFQGATIGVQSKAIINNVSEINKFCK